ncbi:hypothetical protein CLV63_112189 [Murinocardiopsis flavida]|uniref:Glycolipid-binding protein n=1 Tax=Murinocardiopsis flavida TaxID=645275 RepID=A0A2P8DGF4_9ACTN|nr:putative glycolipid-binding domain-containing protein [Murinocardiopsis flavida]PSK96305.1 hypothetical protein CLV63_112189 [Murinocardiopsis flavida]
MADMSEHPVAWRRIDVPVGSGLGSLIAEPDGYRLEGAEMVADAAQRYSCRFTVRTDLAWVTREAEVEVLSAEGVRTVRLSARGGQWTVDGARVPRLDGCVDVDVAAVPLTNTLPIRRLGIAPYEYRDVAVVWIDVPSLDVRRMTQRYTRRTPAGGRDRYQYSDPEFGAFELTVDRDGLVVEYQGLAERLG